MTIDKRKTDQLIRLLNTKHARLSIDLLVITLLATIVFRNWIFTNEWPAGGDVMGWISREYLYGKDYKWMFIWRPNSFGYVEGVNLMDFFFMAVNFVGGNAFNTTKIFAFSSFVLAGFGMYAFGYHCTRRKLAALSGSLIYIFNQWFFTQLTEAHLDLMFSYALAPLIFLFLDRALETKKAKDIVVISFLLGILLTSFHPEAIFIYGIFLALFVVIKLLSRQEPLRFFDRIKSYFKVLIKMGILVVFLSACFWVPMLFNVKAPYLSADYGHYLEETYSYSYKSFADAFILSGTEIGGYVTIVNVTTGISLQILPVAAILLFVFAVAYGVTLIFGLDWRSFFFGVCALVSILISMGPYSPFGSSFIWAWFNVPYFNVFRATSRWAMMVAFSNSFFVCSSASILISYLSKRSLCNGDKFRDSETQSRDNPTKQDIRIGVSFNRVQRYARRLIHYFAILSLAAFLLSGFLSTSYFFSQGLKVYTPPRDQIEPFEYLSTVPGDYKIVTLSRSPSEWQSISDEQLDFSWSGELTPIGWTHDLGFDSTFIHDKPVLQDGGWATQCRDFVSYLRFHVARDNTSRNILKTLGAFNYKYVVIPSYASEDMRSVFLSQYGSNIIRNESNSIILENAFYTPKIFAPAQFALTFGGPKSMFSLCNIDSFSLEKTALLSGYQADNLPFITNNINECAAILFSDIDTSNLAMTLLNDSYLIFPADYGASSLNVTGYWIKGNWWNEDGASVLGGRTLTTYGSTPINIPFEIKSEGHYEIWIRVGYAPDRGKLLASIDSLPIDEITPESGFWSGLKWVNLTPNFHLETGSHIITLTNDGTGYNDVDAIAIVPQGQVDYQRSRMLDLLVAFHGKILYLFEAEEAFSEKVPRGWSIRTYPNKGEGYVLHMENCFSISPEAKASASSTSSGHEAQYAIDGDFITRWASSSGMPQWLEINWPTPQELLGLGINFESAYGKDYRIQTWNGTQWIDQVSVENNSLLFRSHKFPEPVTTDKVRILVTSAPAFGLVSIFEVEAYSTSKMVSSRILIPRKGEYSFSARMIQDENANGTLFLKVDDRLFSAYSPTSPINETEFSWQQLGSTYLDIGEHNVSVSAVGNVDLDQIGVYSSENDTSSLAELFGSSLSSPYTSYVKISPCEYHVHVNCTKPFLLVFSESYNPLWKAYFDDKEVSPIVADSLVNGFFINRTGEFDVTLYFTGQKYADLGLMISGGSAIFIIISVLARFILPKRFRHVSIKLKKKEGFAN